MRPVNSCSNLFRPETFGPYHISLPAFHLIALVMEAVRASENLVNLSQSTWCCSPEDSHLNSEFVGNVWKETFNSVQPKMKTKATNQSKMTLRAAQELNAVNSGQLQVETRSAVCAQWRRKDWQKWSAKVSLCIDRYFHICHIKVNFLVTFC
jgi:hypothetical protein